LSLNDYGVVAGKYFDGSYLQDKGYIYYDSTFYNPPVVSNGATLPAGYTFTKINNSQDILGVAGGGPFVDYVCPFRLDTNVCDWIEPASRQEAIKYFEQTESLCDGLDNDCDGFIDEGLTPELAPKQAGLCQGAVLTCDGRGGWVADYSTVAGYEFPEASCDGLDNDCDGLTDEGIDVDGDTYYGVPLCGDVPDCDDTDPTVYPGAVEVCDGKDNNCNGTPDEECVP
jgi:hypothetical protein